MCPTLPVGSRVRRPPAASVRIPGGAALLALLALLTGCGGGAPPPPPGPAMEVHEGVEADARAAELQRRVQERMQALPAGGAAAGAEPLIGANDLLEVKVFESEELSGSVRVSGEGEISLPLLGAVPAAGLTVRQLEAVLVDRLRSRYIRDPHVAVQVTELQSRPVSVIGAVRQPGVLQLRGARPLLEVLAMAGGLAPDADSEVVLRRGSPAGAAPDSVVTEAVDLWAMLDSGAAAGPLVNPGDVVSVRRAGMVYVVGEVAKPGAFPLVGGEPLTVLRLLALGGGLGRSASRDRVHLVRTAPDGSRTAHVVDMDGVLSGRSPDPRLQAEDVVYVPGNSVRSFTLGAVDALVRVVTFRPLF